MRQIYNELKKIRSDTKCQKSSEANITKDTIQSTNDYNFSAPGLVVIYSSRYSKALVIYPMSSMKKKKSGLTAFPGQMCSSRLRIYN